MEKINIVGQLATISEHWQPLIVGELNGQHVKLAKLQGEFLMHHHDAEDELFLVISGRLVIAFEDSRVTLDPGEFLVIPKGVPHMPIAEEEVAVMLFEPVSTRNTGNVVNERTVAAPRSIV
jgi:mannose-6-phosphate isomerase-like protein (cupin superfamily)